MNRKHKALQRLIVHDADSAIKKDNCKNEICAD